MTDRTSEQPHPQHYVADAAAERLNAALAGRYRIVRALGAGGMATVYLAADLRHDRHVAVKVLKPELAAVLGAERFVVEIKTTASLQHPHILPLFDSGTADGFLFYVMPFIEGETIRDKLNRESQFGVEEAVRIAREVAEALDYAHRHGVIHRDIKPENILLHDGRAMVMDFGIALAVSAAAGGRMTETGLSLGTPHYMSPEQATADKDLTPRTDVYSLASVLYEMLAGQPPHIGGSAQQVIMKILTDEAAPVTTLRKSVPPNVSAAIERGLEKLPADRFESAKAFADALATPDFSYGATAAANPRAPRAYASFAPVVGGAIVAAIGLVVGVLGWQRGGSSDVAPLVPLTLEMPGGRPDLLRFAVSPDGSRFAFASDDGIVVRDSGRLEWQLLPGTQEAESPSFSPDGEWLAFEINGLLRKMPVAGGAAVSVLPNDSMLVGTVRWGQDGSIAFEAGSQIGVLSRSGTMRMLAKADRGQSPRLTPDGRGLFYVEARNGAKLKYYDLAADTTFTLLDDASEGVYLPSGHLLYVLQGGGMFAVRYDLKHHSVSGNPIPVVADIQPNGMIAPYDVTRNGTLVYRAGMDPVSRVLVRDSRGRTDTLPISPKIFGYLKVSPDGRTIALTVGAARGTNRYTELYDIAMGSVTRFTHDGGGHAPVWSPDGKRLAFTADLPGGDGEDIFVQPVDRSTPPVRIFRLPNDQHGSAWPVDSMLVFSTASTSTNLAFGSASGGSGSGRRATVSTTDPSKPGTAPRTYLSAEWSQQDAVISPDGKWAAFTSMESGSSEVYLRRFPDANAAGIVKISSGGGQRARWGGDGRTIYYQALDGKTIRAAHVTTGTTVSVGATEVVMTAPGLGSAWDVDWKTGKIYVSQAVGDNAARIIVLQHWLDAFTRAADGKR